jgi:competence protein ComEC
MHLTSPARLRLLGLAAATSFLAACSPEALGPVATPSPSGVDEPAAAATASGAGIVINEVMADPTKVLDDSGEWLEVYNIGTTAVDLQGWTIASGTERHTIASSVVVAAGGYAVLTRGRTSKQTGGITPSYQYGTSITLANTSDVVTLLDASGATIDSVAWTSGWTAGTARGVINAGIDNANLNGSNWAHQVSTYGKGDLGTPKAINDGAVPPTGTTPEPATVAVTPADASVTVGFVQLFTAAATDAAGNPVTTTFTWSSSNPSVATIDPSGNATGISAGLVTITARAANGIEGRATLTVTAPGDTTPPPGGVQPLVVQVLDIGQGDATLIRNGASTVFIDGGPGMARFGALLDSLGLNNSVIDAIVISHPHADHYNGLRELFTSARNITVRYVYESVDASTNTTLQSLRDSVNARVQRGETILRDTDNPCGNGSAVCTIALDGGAKLHVLRPNPAAADPNNRSTPVKLVGPDSASFAMWFAGDAEHESQDWFDATDYDVSPGMRANVLKANHHGSCNGVKSRYLQLVAPEWVTFSLSATNTYGHVHTQAKDLFRSYGTPWYRTDVNGTVTINAPGTAGSGYTVSVQKGAPSQDGAPDRTSAASACSSL